MKKEKLSLIHSLLLMLLISQFLLLIYQKSVAFGGWVCVEESLCQALECYFDSQDACQEWCNVHDEGCGWVDFYWKTECENIGHGSCPCRSEYTIYCLDEKESFRECYEFDEWCYVWEI